MMPTDSPMPGETDPFQTKNKEAPGNFYAEGAGDFSKADFPPFPGKTLSETGERPVEQAAGFGDSQFCKELNQQAENGSINLMGAINKYDAEFGSEGIIGDYNGSVEADGQSADSIETRNESTSENIEGEDKTNHADRSEKLAGASAFKIATALAFIDKAMAENNPLYVQNAIQETQDAAALAEKADSEASLTNNEQVARLVAGTTEQVRSLAAKISENAEKLTEATEAAQNELEDTPGKSVESLNDTPAETTSLKDFEDLAGSVDEYAATIEQKQATKAQNPEGTENSNF